MSTTIGIIDADLIGRHKHRFPNLACMKLSSWHQSQGHSVDLVMNYEQTGNYDTVYVSKVFTDTKIPEWLLQADNVNIGGTGFYYDKAEPLPYDIEHCMPDYHLYDDFAAKKLEKGVKPKELQYYTDFSIGFTTRGCIRGCSFCVNKNYKKCSLHSPIEEFVSQSRKYICLLDDNILACKDWKDIFRDLNSTGKRFQFKQGMDERLLTDEKCEVIFNSRWIGDYIFAFDNIKDAMLIEEKLKLIRKHTNKVPKFYCFCGYNHDAPNVYPDDFWAKDIADLLERIKILMKYHCLPYIMRYADYEQSPYRGMYINIASWCNQPSFFKKKSFREFCYAQDNRGRSSTIKYMHKFENEHPDIAEEYFNMKWE